MEGQKPSIQRGVFTPVLQGGGELNFIWVSFAGRAAVRGLCVGNG